MDRWLISRSFVSQNLLGKHSALSAPRFAAKSFREMAAESAGVGLDLPNP